MPEPISLKTCSEFILPKWFNPSEELYAFLKQSWNKKYSGLFEGGKDDLESTVTSLLSFLGDNEEKYKSRCLLFCYVCCLATKDTVEAYAPKEVRHLKVLNYLEKALNQQSEIEGKAELDRFNELDYSPYSSGLTDSLQVYSHTVSCIFSEQTLENIQEIFLICCEDDAIAPGDYRPIFNWLLTKAYPAAYALRLPRFIFTRNTHMPEGWQYKQA
ncbi:hypothetical protein [Zooshikella ganghwensis]|uniref:hypothetical protein n=1 Tax=Zooshikella ganghwensis TaxID=202772 RepID=UPI001058CF81|nr:hypothetical protein [Zooshikella ganghwensis]